jgi:DNA repair exonuclease SbcCD ATPase subunit
MKRAEAAERAAKEARAELEKARADRAAAEMAKDFALNRAEEEQAAREAAERMVKEARAELEGKQAAPSPVSAGGPPPDILKGTADMQRALDEAKKRAEDAEAAVAEVRSELAKEKAAKNAAWKVVGQLTKQLQAAKTGDAPADYSSDAPPAKKAKLRLKKKTPDDD